MALIFVVSAQPQLPSVSSGLADTLIKKTAHALEYALLTVLLWRAFSWRGLLLPHAAWRRLAGRQRLIRALVFAFVSSVLYAVSDEFHQTFVPGRNGRWMDVGIDSVGVVLATIGVWRAKRTAP
jgi:VanZ family protein